MEEIEGAKVRVIKLPRGGELEMQMTDAFIDRVRIQFDIPKNEEVTDEHIRMFVFGAMKNATDKAEKKLNDR